MLTYGIDRDGYMRDLGKARLKDAPCFGLEREPGYDAEYDRRLTGYHTTSRI